MPARIISKTRAIPGRRKTKGQKMAAYVDRRKAIKALLNEGARKRAAAEEGR
jgi:hypothetical protein